MVDQLTQSTLSDVDFTSQVAHLEHSVLVPWEEGGPFGPSVAEATRAILSSVRIEFLLLKNPGLVYRQKEKIGQMSKDHIDQMPNVAASVLPYTVHCTL